MRDRDGQSGLGGEFRQFRLPEADSVTVFQSRVASDGELGVQVVGDAVEPVEVVGDKAKEACCPARRDPPVPHGENDGLIWL